MGGFEWIAIVIALLYLANLTWLVRLFFSKRPEMTGFQPTTWFLTISGTIVPYVGTVTGAYYLLFGPTKWRSVVRIDKFIANLKPEQVIDAMYDQLARGGEESTLVRERLLSNTLEQNINILTANFAGYKSTLPFFVTAYSHALFGRGELKADWVGCYKRITYGG